MCGRFNLTASGDELAEEFDLDETPVVTPRFNIAPSQRILTIGAEADGRRTLAERAWGFVLDRPPAPRQGRLPGFEELRDAERSGGRRHINARSETAARSPAFREAFAERRCLVPATGFYEWQRSPGARPQPWLFRMADERPFAFAGLWQPHREPTGLASCLILTTEPNALARTVHDRMPVILAPEDYAAWLAPETRSAAPLRSLLRPFPEHAMEAFPVSAAVNSPALDDPSCLERVPLDRR